MEMEIGESSAIGQNESMELPLGFRFDPYPWELISCYLNPKNSDPKNSDFTPTIEIPEVDLYKIHPKRLTTEKDSSFGIYGTGRHYYFTKRKRRDQRGTRIIRSLNEGSWKNTSKDKVIKDEKNRKVKIGYRKTFKFFEGKGKDKKPTNWIMQEFRDLNTKSVMDESTPNENSNWIEKYVLCMIYERGKKCPTNYPPSTQAVDAIEEVRESSFTQNQSMDYVSQPHEANMDQFRLPPYFGNDNEFPTSQESLDDVRRSMTEPGPENMQLDFLNPNPNTMC